MGIHGWLQARAKRIVLGASLCACVLSLCGAPGAEAAVTAAGAASTANELSRPNAAQDALFAQEQRIAERQKAQAEAAAQGVKPGKAFAPVASLVVRPDPELHMTEKELLRVVSEAGKPMVNIRTLSKQIQFANDGGAMKIAANFAPAAGGYVLTLTAQAVPQQHASVTVTNTGNDYTGNWRVTTSYVDRNVTKHADTLGVAYVTSPSAGHAADVQQAAVAYRYPTGKDAGAVTVTASYSDVDLGSIYSASGIDIGASGKGTTAGLHYQHGIAYTSREKDILDVGIDYWKMRDSYDYRVGTAHASDASDYDVATAGVAFRHNDRDTQHSFSWMAGIDTNLGTVTGTDTYIDGYDKTFQIYKTGMSYQYRTKGDWILGARMMGQYTKNDLVPALQIGAGGRTSVRGFAERAIAADKGVVGTVELFTPEIAPGSRLVAFADAAHLEQSSDVQLFDREDVASVGIGYRYEAPDHRTSVAVDYAVPVKDLPDEWDVQHKRWNVLFSMSF